MANQAYPHQVWFWAIMETKLPGPTKLVAAALAAHIKSRKDSCYPSLNRLMEVTSMSKSTVIKHLRNLQVSGWLGVSKRPARKSSYMSNLYILQMPGGTAAGLGSATGGLGDSSVNKLGSIDDVTKVVHQIDPNNRIRIEDKNMPEFKLGLPTGAGSNFFRKKYGITGSE